LFDADAVIDSQKSNLIIILMDVIDKYNFDKVIDRFNSDSHKWNDYPQDILPMSLADMDFKVAKEIIDALEERVKHGIFGYPQQLTNELYGIIADYMHSNYGWSIDYSDIMLLSSTHDAFKLVFRMIGAVGDEILMNTPLYPPLLWAPATVGKKLTVSELQRDSNGEYSIDFDKLEAAITEKTNIFLLCNPHNPTGRVYTRGELEKLAEIAIKHNLIICSDDVHFGIVFQGHRYTPIASLSKEISQRTVTLINTGKTFNTPGLKFSIAITKNKDIWKVLRGQLDNYPAGLFGILAASTALKKCENWRKQMIKYLSENISFMHENIKSNMPQVKLTPMQGTFLAWLDMSAYTFPTTPFDHLMKAGKIAVGDGRQFGAGGENFVRLNIACPRTVLKDALDRIQTALTAL
jgi:cystathionine beta-lyase